jgi:aromatic ring-opening dioxygenase LigB subunit
MPRLLLALFACVAPQHASAGVVGAAVIPHGDFAYDPSLVHNANGSAEVHAAAIKAGEYIASLHPDVIFLSTPHGVALSNDFAMYTNSLAAGFAAIGGDLHNASVVPYKVPLNSTRMDSNLTSRLISELGGDSANVSALASFADSEPQALRWGEVVPLKLIPSSTLSRARLVILSQPLRRYTDAEGMVPELQRLGAATFRTLDALAERVVLLISSDLAHTHLASGPYGYSPAAKPFDAAIGRWATDPLGHAPALLKEAAGLEAHALSCGFTGLVMLHGALLAEKPRWSPHLLANRAPTYYGMMVATF